MRYALLLLLLPLLCPAQNNTTSGEFASDPPTITALGFEWKIAGDDNRNARVDVTFRKTGEHEWRKALPLFRLQHESVTGGTPRNNGASYYSYIAPNMFAGSILNLEPDTSYECRFVLTDPDGVKGKTERTVTARTRKEPQPQQAARSITSILSTTKAPRSSPPSLAYWPPITWAPISRTIPTRSRRACSRATPSSCTPACIRTTVSSTAASTATWLP